MWSGEFKLGNIVEVDETYVGGKDKNKYAVKRLNAGHGTYGKTAVVGVQERGGRVIATPVERADAGMLIGFVEKSVEAGSMVCTDSATASSSLPCKYEHQTVAHGAGECVSGLLHTNGTESAWSLLKRAIQGTWHHVSPKHLGRYVNKVAFGLNEGKCQEGILDRMVFWAQEAGGKRISYEALIANNGLSGEAQAA